jgi:hypothetical protein
MDVSTSRFELLPRPSGFWGRDVSFISYKAIQGAFEELESIVTQGRQRNRRFSRDKVSGVWMPLCRPTKYHFPLPNPLISPITTQQ